MMSEKRLYALRGAARCLNEVEDITVQVAALYDELLSANSLTEGDIVSLIFSVTPDLDAQNPAAALRKSGRGGDLALFCVQEAAAKGGLSVPFGSLSTAIWTRVPFPATCTGTARRFCGRIGPFFRVLVDRSSPFSLNWFCFTPS
jgi:chorismate mutase